MKKWLVTCLLAIALLFVATTAMAAHIRLNGDYCEGNTFEIRKREKEYHTLYCYRCYDEFTENHWSIDTPQYKATCTKVAVCTSCLMSYGEYGPHDWGEWKSSGNGSHTTPASIMLHTPKRRIVPSAQRPAPNLSPALSAVRLTCWVMTGADGRPTEIKPTPIPASAIPATPKRKPAATFRKRIAQRLRCARIAGVPMGKQPRTSTHGGGSRTPMATAPTPIPVIMIPPTKKRKLAPATARSPAGKRAIATIAWKNTR